MTNKTSDKNVGSIEEDIRILQEKDCMWHYPETRIEEAIENIIADYTRQKEINEEHQKINGELRQAINTVEKEKADWIKAYQEEKDSQFELLKRIKELESKNKYLESLSECQHSYLLNSIQKQVVKDVLQNNRNELFGMTYLSKEQYKPYEMQIERLNKIEQELLETK